jgi:hypothetical protein
MKKSFFIFISCLLVVSLDARENPFEPTDIYTEKQADFLKQLQLEQEKEKKMQEEVKLHEQAMLQREKEIEDLELQRQEELRRIEELKAQRAALEKQKQQELQRIQQVKAQELQKLESMKQQKLLQMKKEQMAKMNKYNVLPFVHIEANDDTLTIFVDTKFKLINQEILEDRKKILYDFRAHASFYTISKNLQSDAFKKFTVGTHKKKGFFRIVIEVTDKTSSYLEKIDTKEGKITLLKK